VAQSYVTCDRTTHSRAQQFEARLDPAWSVRVLYETCDGCVIRLQSGLDCEPSVFSQAPDDQRQQHQQRNRQEQCGQFLKGRVQREVCLLSLVIGTRRSSCFAARAVLAWLAEGFVYGSLWLHRRLAFRAWVNDLEVVCQWLFRFASQRSAHIRSMPDLSSMAVKSWVLNAKNVVAVNCAGLEFA
jgi:hypothetical protein